MANGAGVGIGSAYLQLEVPKDNLSQSLQYWGGIKARENAADKLAAERAAKQRAKDLQNYNVNPKDFDIENAGYTDYNDANRAFASRQLSKVTDLLYDAKQAFTRGDVQLADSLKGQADKITSSFKNLQAMSETYKKNFEDFRKDSEAGKVSGWSKGFGNFYRGALVEGKMIFGENNNGETVRMVQFKDDQGNLKTQMMSDRDAASGNARYYLKQDINKMTTDISKDLGKTVEEAVAGYYTTKNIQWGDKQQKAADELINAQVNSPEVMADLVDQFDLYEEFGIDKDNPPIKPNFTDEQKKKVADKLLETVKGKYNEEMTQKFNSQKYGADTRAATARAKGKDKNDVLVSNLKYDVDQALKGDYTGLLKNYTDQTSNTSFNITEVVESADGQSLTLVKDDGTTLPPLPKNPRAISDFMIRNTPEYTKSKVGTERVLSAEANPYRGGTAQASDISSSIREFFDTEGKFKKGKTKQIVERLRGLGYEGTTQINWFSPDVFTVNGIKINLGSGSSFKEVSDKLKQAVQAGEADPLGLGI